jgi:protein arginine kinase activator
MGNFPISQFLSGLMHLDAPKVGKQSAQPVRCQTCGMTYQQFSKMGRFGCKDCYRFFGDHLDSLLRRVHGSAAHTGKVPNRAAGRIKVKREIEQLKQQLQRHIQREEFELAAQVRDRLRALENDWTDASSGGE